MISLERLDDSTSYARRDRFLRDVQREFIEVPQEHAMMQFAAGQNCMTSDVFILYAIGYMGVSNIESIVMFLRALKRKNPDLEIIDQMDNVKHRLQKLFIGGYIFKSRFCEEKKDYEENKARGNGYVLYSVSGSGMKVVGQRLQKMIPENQEVFRMPVEFLLAWASATYVVSAIAWNAPKFSRYLDRTLKTKQIVPTWFMPGELKFVDNTSGKKYYVSVTDAFLIHDKSIMTQEDYNENCARKINCIKNYLATKARGNDEEAKVIVVIRDSANLRNFGLLLEKVEYLDEYLDHIYITGEGLVRAAMKNMRAEGTVSMGDAMYKFKKASDGQYKLVEGNPEFL